MTAGSLMASAAGLQKTLTINTSKKGAEIPKTMYGLFFEDINFGADGGLYAEKIKNRSFEFDYPLQGWKAAGKVEVKNNGPFPRNPPLCGAQTFRTLRQAHGSCERGLLRCLVRERLRI